MKHLGFRVKGATDRQDVASEDDPYRILSVELVEALLTALDQLSL